MKRISDKVLAEPVEGVNLRPGSLSEQIGVGPSLLIFLRHFG